MLIRYIDINVISTWKMRGEEFVNIISKRILTIEKIKCTGCGACQNICPTAAIFMVTDQEGFWYPSIDEDKCSNCKRCTKVCLATQNPISENRDESQTSIYAAWSMNKMTRFYSTSGGIFSELALVVLEKSGVVCGASYNGNHDVEHIFINNEDELKKLRQSKYVQSDMGDTYKKIVTQLCEDKQVLFCGTPCQCQEVFHYCEESGVDTSDLYLIDFICRGSNSPKVYRKFLEELEEKYQSKVSRVWFKNKTYGWNCFSTKIDFNNGTCYLEDRFHDTYIRGYIEENLYIRPSCSDCKFKGLKRIADITLADFWGVQLEDNIQETDGGTSMVMVHTEKGKRLWNSIKPKVFWKEKKLEDVIPGNDCFEHSVKPGVHREQFFSDLDNMSVIDNIERFLRKRK